MAQKQAVSVERMHVLETDTPTKAFCDVLLFDTFIVKGLRVVEGKEGLFLSMPREQGRDGKWYDTFHPVSKELRAGLQELILDHYKNAQQ